MSALLKKLQEDLATARAELAKAEDRQKQLRWKVQYIETLLESGTATEKPGGTTEIIEGEPRDHGRYHGLTIAEVAIHVLRDSAGPLACIEIARRAMFGGFQAENIERARSHFSAVISKDLSNGEKSKFWQIDRGLIGLREWKKLPPPPTQPVQPPPPAPRPQLVANEPPPAEQTFSDDDIPF